MIFKLLNRIHNRDLSIKINNTTIEFVNIYKYSGIYIDTKFNFSKHIN